MLTSVGTNCLAVTGSPNTLLLVLAALVVVGFGVAIVRARAKGKRATSALLLLGALALGGFGAAAYSVTPAQAATGGNVCEAPSPTPTPTPTQAPLTIVFVGEQYLTTQVPVNGDVELQNGVNLALTQDVTICEEAESLTNCVTFAQGDLVNTTKTLLLSGVDKKLNFAAQGYKDYLLFSSMPADPFDWNAKSDVVVPPGTLTTNSYSNGTTIYFSVMAAVG